MKQQQKLSVLIAALLLCLAWSIALNFMYDDQVDRLMDELKDMEYTQRVLSDHIQELESQQGEEADYAD